MSKTRTGKKALSLLLTLCMVLGMLPALGITASAANYDLVSPTSSTDTTTLGKCANLDALDAPPAIESALSSNSIDTHCYIIFYYNSSNSMVLYSNCNGGIAMETKTNFSSIAAAFTAAGAYPVYVLTAPPAPIYADGFGTADLTFENPGTVGTAKGYTFAGWFNGATELTSAASAEAGTTYTAKWTKDGKTVRTMALDLTTDGYMSEDGVVVSSSIYTKATEGWSWDNTNKKLILDGATIDTADAVALKIPAGTTVVITDDTQNTITSTCSTKASTGIFIASGAGNSSFIGGTKNSGTLTVNSGNVNVTVDDMIDATSYAIDCESNSTSVLTINANIDANAGSSATTDINMVADSCAIKCFYGKLNITGGTVSATGTTASGPNSKADSRGIFAGTGLTVSGGSLAAEGGTATASGSTSSYGINCALTATAGTVTASGSTKAISSTNVVVSGAAIKAGDSAPGSTVTSYGNEKWVNFTFTPTITFNSNGGSAVDPVEVSAITALPTPTFGTYTLDGWYQNADLTGTKLTLDAAKALTASATYYAKWTNGGKTVITAPLDFTGSVTLPEGCGITWYADAAGNGTGTTADDHPANTLVLSGATIDCSASTATADTAGLKLPASSTIVLAAGSVNTVTSAESTGGNSYGIHLVGSTTITGAGTLTATGGKAGATDHMSCGIYFHEGLLSVVGGADVCGKTTADSNNGLAVCGYWYQVTSSISVENAKLKGECANAAAATTGIFAGNNITATNAELIGRAGSGSPSDKGIVSSNGTITLTDTSVTASTGGTGTNDYAVSADSGITASGATVTNGTFDNGAAFVSGTTKRIKEADASKDVTISFGPSITVGAQNAARTAGDAAADVTFGVTTSNYIAAPAAGDLAFAWTSTAPAGVGTPAVTGSDNTYTLTMNVASTTPAGSYGFTVSTGSGAVSATGTLVVSPAVPTVEYESTTGFSIYANGNPLIIEAYPDQAHSANVYVDVNNNGIRDEGDTLISLAVDGAPTEVSFRVIYAVYGGSKNTAFAGNTRITMTGGKVVFLVGGCLDANMTGDAALNVTGGTVSYLYGGCISTTATPASLTGNAAVNASGGEFMDVLGGCGKDGDEAAAGTVSGDITLSLSGTAKAYHIVASSEGMTDDGTLNLSGDFQGISMKIPGGTLPPMCVILTDSLKDGKLHITAPLTAAGLTAPDMYLIKKEPTFYTAADAGTTVATATSADLLNMDRFSLMVPGIGLETVGTSMKIKLVPTRTEPLDLTSTSVNYVVAGLQDGTLTPATADAVTAEGWSWYHDGVTVDGTAYTGKVLVLSGLWLETTAALALQVPTGTTIVLKAGTTNTVKSTYAGNAFTAGITTYKDGTAYPLTIDGSGTLNAIAGTSTTGGTIYNSIGIHGNGVTINNGNITATGGASAANSIGISADTGVLTINGGTVKGQGGTSSRTSSADGSFGLYATGDIEVKGGSVTGNAGTATNALSIGAFSGATINVTAGSLTASGSTAAMGAANITFASTLAINTPSNGVVGAYSSMKTILASSTATTPATSATIGTKPTPPSGGGTPSVTVPVSSNEGSVSVSASVSNGTASVTVTDAQLGKVISNAETTGTVTVDVSGLTNVDSAKIPAKLLTAANGATGSDGLEVVLATGTVKLDGTALASAAAEKKDITISVEEVKTSALTSTQKESLGSKVDSAVVVDINVLVNGVKTSDFGGGTLTISIPYTAKSGEDTSKLTVWYLADDGSITAMNGKYDAVNKAYVFTTTHLSTYVLTSFPFADVAAGSYYYNAVAWAVANGTTEGTSATTFSPDAICTRAQMVTFLWRAMGSPEPTSTTCPFTDVDANAYYYKAVLWAAEKGITEGTSETTFSPNDTVTRVQVVTLEWRAAGKPAATAANPFNDVASGTYYEDAVLWAVAQKITEGTSTTTFSPVDPCTRAQIVTFLYRYLAK